MRTKLAIKASVVLLLLVCIAAAEDVPKDTPKDAPKDAPKKAYTSVGEMLDDIKVVPFPRPKAKEWNDITRTQLVAWFAKINESAAERLPGCRLSTMAKVTAAAEPGAKMISIFLCAVPVPKVWKDCTVLVNADDLGEEFSLKLPLDSPEAKTFGDVGITGASCRVSGIISQVTINGMEYYGGPGGHGAGPVDKAGNGVAITGIGIDFKPGVVISDIKAPPPPPEKKKK